MSYKEWSDKNNDSIALCIGATYAIILIIFVVLGHIYCE